MQPKVVLTIINGPSAGQEFVFWDAVPIRKRDASLPPSLAAVIDTALVDNPKIGFQTAADLKAALEQVV